MVELRTYSEESEGSDGFDLEGMLQKAWQNIQSDPQAQARLAQQLQESGIDPMLLGAVKPGLADAMQQAEQKQAVEQATNEPTPEPEVKTVTEKPEPEEIKALLDDIIDQFGEDKTLGELKEFIDENPDLVETAVNLRL